MIDEDVVMVDNSRASRDLNFDLSKVRVCASACVQSNIYREDNKVQKQHPSASVSLSSFSFTSLPPSGSKPGLTYPIPQQTHTDTQQAHTPFQSYKDILLWEWECIFRSYSFPLTTNTIGEVKNATTLVS